MLANLIDCAWVGNLPARREKALRPPLAGRIRWLPVVQIHPVDLAPVRRVGIDTVIKPVLAADSGDAEDAQAVRGYHDVADLDAPNELACLIGDVADAALWIGLAPIIRVGSADPY